MDATPRPLRIWLGCCLLACSTVLISCETLRAPGSTADWFARNSKGHEREAQSWRTQWQTKRDRKAIRWLLSTQIKNGLTLQEVNERLGDTGERETNVQGFKRSGDGFRVDDHFYRFGPDNDGQVYYIVFRDGKVINYEGERFAEP